MSEATKLKCDGCHSITNPRPYYRKGEVKRVDCNVCGATLYNLGSWVNDTLFWPSVGLTAIGVFAAVGTFRESGDIPFFDAFGVVLMCLAFAAPAVLGQVLKKRALRNAAATIERLTAAAR